MAEITIDDIAPRKVYAVGATAQDEFAVPFVFFSSTDLRVYVGGDLLDLGDDYTVVGAGVQAGGTVTLADAVTNTTVAIVRRVPVDRLTDFPAAGPFKIPALNRELDRLVAMLQQAETDMLRSLRLPEDEDLETGALPALADRAGRPLGFDADGAPVASTVTMAAMEGVVTAGVAAGKVIATVPPVTSDGTLEEVDTGYTLSSAAQADVVVGGLNQAGRFTVGGSTTSDFSSVFFPEPVPEGVEVAIRILGVSPDAPGTGDVAYTPALPLGATASGGSSVNSAAVDHVHPLPDLSGLGAAPEDHDHVIADVTGLQAALDAKAGETATTAALALKAPLASPTFTGTPAAPTASPGTNTTQVSTTAFVQAAIAALVASSPSTLDTLNELAAALGDDPNFATTVTNLLAGKAPLASPALTGTPTAPTASQADNSTKIATTAYVDTGLALKAPLASPTLTGTPAAPTAAVGTNTTQLATTAFVNAQAEQVFVFCLSDETTALTTGTAKVTWRAPWPGVWTRIPTASLSTVSTSGLPTVDVNLNGTSILGTNKLSIDANEKTSVTAATATTIATAAFAADDEFTFDQDVAGTGAKGMKVTMYARRTA